MVTVPTLKLMFERKIRDLLPREQKIKRCEASGVLVKDGHFFVVFDDRTEIARLSEDSQPNDANALVRMSGGVGGYEGVAYNAAKERFYLLVETRKQFSGCYTGCDR